MHVKIISPTSVSLRSATRKLSYMGMNPTINTYDILNIRTCAKYNLLCGGDKIRFIVFYELNAHRRPCFRIKYNFRHCRKFQQIKIRSLANWSEESFAGADSVTISYINLHGGETDEPVAVVIY